MKLCKKCVQPDTRPSIRFDDEGVCPACRFAERAHEIDWAVRHRELKEIIAETREYNESQYDMILGVSGGKDSVRLAMFAKEELGLRVFLVSCTGSPEHVTHLGAYNLSNMINLGFDLMTVGPGPQTWKKLIRRSFLEHGNVLKATEMALYASCPKIAISMGIPLIAIGENPAITIGELGTGSTTGDASKMRFSNTIASGPDVFLSDEIQERQLHWYRYPSIAETDRARMRIIYLGYYIENFAKVANAEFAMNVGMKVRKDPPQDLGDITGYEALDDNFVAVNQMMKYFKLGFGKVTDQVCEEIRLGKMSRETGIELVKKYDGGCARDYVLGFCDYIGISEEKFWEVANSYRNPKIWSKDTNGNWVLQYE